MIVNYGDFTFVKDDGFIALARTREGSEPEILCRVKLGDSLGDLVSRVWTHSGASAEVTGKVLER